MSTSDATDDPELKNNHLTPAGLLKSDLWLDKPDAVDAIGRRIASGRISEEQGVNLRQYAEDGYLSFDLNLDESVYSDLEASVNRMWQEKPSDIVYAFDGPLRRMHEAEEATERRPPYRIMGLETHCEAAMSLYLNRTIFDYLRLIFEERPVATQSIYFQYGSRQQLHRDPVHVYMDPPSHLAAAWVALEDIHPEGGPLTYVPGSHKLPYFQFEPGVYQFDHYSHTAADANRMALAEEEQAKAHGLAAEAFLPKRGQVLIWHHSLLHGGSPGSDAITRKSFVVHYTTMQYYDSSMQSISKPDGVGGREMEIWQSYDVFSRNGCQGFRAPVLGALAS